MPHDFSAQPWRVAGLGSSLLILDADGCIVATVGSPRATLSDIPRVNALLLAAAPRLLKHLEKAYKVLTRLSDPVLDNAADGDVIGPGADEMMDAMQRAIGDAGGSTE